MLQEQTKTKNRKLLPEETAACINYIAVYLISSRLLYPKNNSTDMTELLSVVLKENFDLSLTNGQINNLICKARKRIEEFAGLNITQKGAWYTAYLLELLDRIRKAGDYKSELPVLKEIAAVESIYPDKNDRELQFKALFESSAKDNMSEEQKIRIRSGEEPFKIFANS
jgi:hypothetical protein